MLICLIDTFTKNEVYIQNIYNTYLKQNFYKVQKLDKSQHVKTYELNKKSQAQELRAKL